MNLPRFYPILDTSRSLPLLDQAKVMLDGGAEILQVRHKGEWTRRLFDELSEIAEWKPPQLIVNDRVDIAALAGAGVHLGQSDLRPSEARKVAAIDVIGYSTHNREQFLAAEGERPTYLALGPIYSTASKQNPDPVVGLSLLRELRPLTQRPIVAIGGITRQNAADVLDAGADSVAVIADLYPPEVTIETLRARVEEWRRLLS